MIRSFKRLLKDEMGHVLIFVGFFILTLFAVAGSAIDLGRSQIVRHKMHQAGDAAALAGAAAPFGISEAERLAIVQRYFELNFPDEFMGSTVTIDDVVIQFDPDGYNPRTVNVQVASEMDTRFVNMVGINEIGIASESEVGVNQAFLDLDVVIVADGTGSMDDTDGYGIRKIDGLRQAASRLAEMLLDPANQLSPNDKVRIGIIEYNTGIKTPILAFTNELDAVRARMNAFDPNGCTNGGFAAEIGRNMIISPNPRPDDGKTGAVKAFIFLTDGIFNSYGPEVCTTAGIALSEDAFAAACQDVADNNVIRYTIRFGGEGNATLLRDCASDPSSEHFFNSPSVPDLIAAFEQIAIDLRNVRITK